MRQARFDPDGVRLTSFEQPRLAPEKARQQMPCSYYCTVSCWDCPWDCGTVCSDECWISCGGDETALANNESGARSGNSSSISSSNNSNYYATEVEQ